MNFIVDVTISNKAANSTKNYLLVEIMHPESGKLLGEGFFEVNVDAKMTKNFTLYVKALEAHELDYNPIVSASLNFLGEKVPCSTCGGEGKGSLIRWLLMLFKKRYKP